MALDVEELVAPQVVVAYRHRRVDGRRADFDVHLGRLRWRGSIRTVPENDVKRPRTSVNTA